MLSGCAITYTNSKTGATEVFGLVHVKVLPATSGAQPFVVADVSSVGISIAKQADDRGLVIGYNRVRYVRASSTETGSILIADGVVTCMASDDSCIRKIDTREKRE